MNPTCGCGRFTARRGPKGYYYCRFCDEWECVGERNELALYQYQKQFTHDKSSIYSAIEKRQAISLSTLRRRFPELRSRDFYRFIDELAKEGKIVIQQSGFVGDNLNHGKLVVAR